MPNYTLFVNTSNEQYSGTDFRVLAKIICENGTSPNPSDGVSHWVLDSGPEGSTRGRMERGSHDKYLIEGVYAGVPKKLQLICGDYEHTNPEHDWKLANVAVRDERYNITKSNDYNQWIRAAPGGVFLELDLTDGLKLDLADEKNCTVKQVSAVKLPVDAGKSLPHAKVAGVLSVAPHATASGQSSAAVSAPAEGKSTVNLTALGASLTKTLNAESGTNTAVTTDNSKKDDAVVQSQPSAVPASLPSHTL